MVTRVGKPVSVMLPPWRSTIWRLTASPSPAARFLVVKNTLDALELPVFDPARIFRRAEPPAAPHRHTPWQ